MSTHSRCIYLAHKKFSTTITRTRIKKKILFLPIPELASKVTLFNKNIVNKKSIFIQDNITGISRALLFTIFNR